MYFRHMLQIKFINTYEIALTWMPQNVFDDMSTLVQVMAWCCQARNLCIYMSQCWPRMARSAMPYTCSVIRPQWIECMSIKYMYLFCLKKSPLNQLRSSDIYTGWETSTRPLANASENLARREENRPGQVEFCKGYKRDCPVRASAKKF